MQIQSQSVVRVLIVVVARANIGNPESLLAELGSGALSCHEITPVHRLCSLGIRVGVLRQTSRVCRLCGLGNLPRLLRTRMRGTGSGQSDNSSSDHMNRALNPQCCSGYDKGGAIVTPKAQTQNPNPKPFTRNPVSFCKS